MIGLVVVVTYLAVAVYKGEVNVGRVTAVGAVEINYTGGVMGMG